MKAIKTVAFVGAGALGILFGQQMTKTLGKEHVYFIVDEARKQRYQREKFFCNGQPCDFSYQSVPQTTADLIVFTTKYTTLADAISLAKPFAGSDTLFISCINGITSEQDLANAFGATHVLGCVAQGMDATKKDNAVIYQNMGQLVFGTLKDGQAQLATALQTLLEAAHIPHTYSTDIQHSLWSKLMLNVGVNQACAVYDCTYRGVQEKESEAHRMMVAAMQEALVVANAHGIHLTQQELDEWVSIVDTLNPDGMPSMRQDTLAGRKTEKALFAGTICNLGKTHGIATPVNDLFLEKLNQIETPL